jgi:pyridoxamine 5'-phosphate oxidase-like protein
MSSLPRAARRILNEGTLCYLAAPSAAGPHVTPVVFVLDGGRVWGTTGRGTTKAKLWRRGPVAGGLVGWKGRWLTFRGPVTLYDALDPGTWPASLRRGPRVASASVRFSLKNARFFAGYARDVTRVPLAWTPPGRVIFSIDLASGALLDSDEVGERWGSWGSGIDSPKTFRGAKLGFSATALPEEVRGLLDDPGPGTLGLASRDGPTVLPARWTPGDGEVFARLPAAHRSLAGSDADGPAALVVDRASAWRAANMRGVLLRGDASTYVAREVRSGRAELTAAVGDLADEEAVVRIRPRTAVWWSGWASGTVRRP